MEEFFLSNFFDVLKFLSKGEDVRNLPEEQKKDLFHMIAFLKQQNILREKASIGNLDGDDFELMYKTLDVLQKNTSFIQELINTNQSNENSEGYNF